MGKNAVRIKLWEMVERKAHRRRTELQYDALKGQRARNLLSDIKQLDFDLDKILEEPQNQVRNRNAIELHGKLNRLQADISEMSHAEKRTLEPHLNIVMDRLLREVFNIDPDKVREKEHVR